VDLGRDRGGSSNSYGDDVVRGRHRPVEL